MSFCSRCDLSWLSFRSSTSTNTIKTPSILCSAVRNGRIRTEYHRPSVGLDLAPYIAHPLEDLRDRFIQVRKVDADTDMADRAADVTRKQVKQLLRRG